MQVSEGFSRDFFNEVLEALRKNAEKWVAVDEDYVDKCTSVHNNKCCTLTPSWSAMNFLNAPRILYISGQCPYV